MHIAVIANVCIVYDASVLGNSKKMDLLDCGIQRLAADAGAAEVIVPISTEVKFPTQVGLGDQPGVIEDFSFFGRPRFRVVVKCRGKFKSLGLRSGTENWFGVVVDLRACAIEGV
jgi:hypothetical protein